MKENDYEKSMMLIKKLLITVISVLLISTNCCLSVFAEIITVEIEDISYEFTVNDDFADDRILVVLTKETSWQFKEYEADDFSEIRCKSVKAMATTKFEKGKKALENIAYAVENNKEPVIDRNLDLSEYNNILCLELENPGKQNVLDAIKELKKREDVLCAEPDYRISLASNYTSEISVLSEEDELYYKTYLGLSDEPNGIDARRLVDFDDPITIGIIDSGIDGEREFSFLVSGESVDFTDYDDYDPEEDYVPVNLKNDSTDVKGHGTHVAGIIASTVDRYFNFGTINYSNAVQFISVRAFDADGNADLSSIVCAIDYLNNRGVPIINYSAGGHLPFQYTVNDSALENAIENYDGLFVCAAGNGDDGNAPLNIDATPFFPAAWDLDNMITVGASNANDTIHSTSNYGKTTVDIFAPGENIYSCYPLGLCNQNIGSCEDPDTHISYGYHSLSGTSMATGFVTGVAALVIQAYNQYGPNSIFGISPEYIKDIIMDSSNSYLAAFENKCVSEGRLDAYDAVEATILDICAHNNVRYEHTNSIHTVICIDCDYEVDEPHSLSVAEIYDGDNGCDIGCLYCEYNFHCDCTPEYGATDTSGHSVVCPDGLFYFFENHTFRNTYLPADLYYHTLECIICDYSFEISHTWVTVGSPLTCSVCGYTSNYGPGIMSLSDEELALMLATLSDEEISSLMFALNETDRGRIAVLLPEREDDYVSE